ncbi:hypothetical protein SAMD00019534_089830, partial [Acytostelium subglobosum LB1]|uniref:hypothetical protein n=1 Tax=Acytostelium subglobosum LB1 TaxID=1410327 RepID=UPI0006448BC3
VEQTTTTTQSTTTTTITHQTHNHRVICESTLLIQSCVDNHQSINQSISHNITSTYHSSHHFFHLIKPIISSSHQLIIPIIILTTNFNVVLSENRGESKSDMAGSDTHTDHKRTSISVNSGTPTGSGLLRLSQGGQPRQSLSGSFGAMDAGAKAALKTSNNSGSKLQPQTQQSLPQQQQQQSIVPNGKGNAQASSAYDNVTNSNNINNKPVEIKPTTTPSSPITTQPINNPAQQQQQAGPPTSAVANNAAFPGAGSVLKNGIWYAESELAEENFVWAPKYWTVDRIGKWVDDIEFTESQTTATGAVSPSTSSTSINNTVSSSSTQTQLQQQHSTNTTSTKPTSSTHFIDKD